MSESPEIATKIMTSILADIEDADCYVNDIGCFGKSCSSHLHLLEKVLACLQDAGFAINPLKCDWEVKESGFLGHWMTPTGTKPRVRRLMASLKCDLQ